MRIPLFYIPGTKYKKFLHIERSYVSPRIIIPIGCDCHPAYSLQKLHLRRKGYPFDWLNTIPLSGIKYVHENIASRFVNFIVGLSVNASGNIVASSYPYAEFIHEKDLAKSTEDRQKIERRISRFLTDISKQGVVYLYNIPASGITTSEEVDIFIQSVETFITNLKKDDSLHVYIRYDETFEENREVAENLLTSLNNLERVHACRYIRGLGKYGIWGNPNDYITLYKNLNICVKEVLPKIFVK